MPKSLGKVLNDAFSKAGVANDNAALMSLLQNKELATIQVDDELTTAFEGNLHSLDSAKAKLKSQLFAEAYNGLDTELERTMDELQLDDATKAELKSEKSSTKRAAALAKKIQALEAAKAKAAPADKAELTQKINDLNQKLADTIKAKDTEMTQKLSAKDAELIELAYDNMIAGYDLAVPEGFTKEDIILLAKNKLNAARTADKLRIVRQNGQLAHQTETGEKYFDKTQTEKDLKSYTESVLAQHKLLKTNDPNPKGTGNQPATIPGTPTIPASTQQLLSNLDKQIAEMTAP